MDNKIKENLFIKMIMNNSLSDQEINNIIENVDLDFEYIDYVLSEDAGVSGFATLGNPQSFKNKLNNVANQTSNKLLNKISNPTLRNGIYSAQGYINKKTGNYGDLANTMINKHSERYNNAYDKLNNGSFKNPNSALKTIDTFNDANDKLSRWKRVKAVKGM